MSTEWEITGSPSEKDESVVTEGVFAHGRTLAAGGILGVASSQIALLPFKSGFYRRIQALLGPNGNALSSQSILTPVFSTVCR